MCAAPLPPLDGHAPPAGLSSAWQGIAAGVSRPPHCLSHRLSGCGMVCGFGGMCLRTVPLSAFFLIPSSQPNDMPCSLHRLALRSYLQIMSLRTQTRVTTLTLPPRKAGGVSVFSLPCFAGISPSFSCLHSGYLSVSTRTGPLFRGDGDKGAS